MAIALARKKIHCPNCQFEGKALVKGAGAGLLILFCILFVISIFFWPLFIATGLVLVIMVFKPAPQISPKCKFENPIPLKQWQQSQGLT